MTAPQEPFATPVPDSGRRRFAAAFWLQGLRHLLRCKLGHALLALPLAVAATPRAAGAQSAPGAVEVGICVGRFIGGSFARGSTVAFDRKVDVDDKPIGGLWLAAVLDRDWGIEFAYRRTPQTHIIEYSGGVFPTQETLAKLDVASVEVLAVRALHSGAFVPYLGAGVGITNLDIDVPNPAVRDVNRPGLALTGGARFFATRWLGARIDLRGRATYLGKRGLGEDRGWSDTGRWFADMEVSGGLFVSLGGK